MKNIEKNVSLSNKTSFRIGGPAKFYTKVRDEDEIRRMLQWANKNNFPVFILGKGTNVLISDNGWPGLVLDTTDFNAICWDGTSAVCRSGALLYTLVKESVDRGCCGMEQLAGIPGSVGGALVMNAGAYTQTISDCLSLVKGIESSRYTIWDRNKSEIDFNYRYSSLKSMNSVILGAKFSFNKGDKEKLKSVFHEMIKRRNEKHPLDKPNCGSVFKNPAGHYAAALIEKCGLKGHRINGAQVSMKHANFIVTISDASASDVRKLIIFIQEQVFKNQGILLEPEVIFTGEFDTPLFKP